MAKTKKKEEIIDFTKPEKITEEQLTKLKALVKDVNLMHHELGVFEGRKHHMLGILAKQQASLAEMQEEFKKEYGTLNIDINDGTIKYDEENGEINKED